MPFARHVSVASVWVALLASTVACSGGEEEPEATFSSSAATAPPSSSPIEPSSAETGWQDKYTSAQLEAYGAALARYEEYETRTEPVWAEGKVTGRAEALFKQFFPSPLWQGRLRMLTTYEQVDVRVEDLANVYWSRAKSISDSGLSVVIEQCVDYTTVKVTQRGELAQPVQWQQKPNLRTINLEKPEDSAWLIYGIVDASSGEPRPCTR